MRKNMHKKILSVVMACTVGLLTCSMVTNVNAASTDTTEAIENDTDIPDIVDDFIDEDITSAEETDMSGIQDDYDNNAYKKSEAVDVSQFETEPEAATEIKESSSEMSSESEFDNPKVKDSESETEAKNNANEKPWYHISIADFLMQLLVAVVVIVLPGCWIYNKNKK